VLRKIDCVMLKVGNLATATGFYASEFGLVPRWRDEHSVGLGLPESDAEVVLHTMDLPPGRHVYFLVDDVVAAVAEAAQEGCAVLTPPFDVATGKCAIIADPFGNDLGLIDMTRGPRA
jgi:predicted enzyme related to lactoylglutathione lyase